MTTAAAQLRQAMSKYDPAVAAVARAAHRKLRALLPKATELVYDNYNALVITFGGSERPADILISIALYPRWVTVFFANGATLADPTKRLSGSGAKIRGLRLGAASDLEEPDVIALVRRATAKATFTRRALLIQSVSAKQRPRRSAS